MAGLSSLKPDTDSNTIKGKSHNIALNVLSYEKSDAVVGIVTGRAFGVSNEVLRIKMSNNGIEDIKKRVPCGGVIVFKNVTAPVDGTSYAGFGYPAVHTKTTNPTNVVQGLVSVKAKKGTSQYVDVIDLTRSAEIKSQKDLTGFINKLASESSSLDSLAGIVVRETSERGKKPYYIFFPHKDGKIFVDDLFDNDSVTRIYEKITQGTSSTFDAIAIFGFPVSYSVLAKKETGLSTELFKNKKNKQQFALATFVLEKDLKAGKPFIKNVIPVIDETTNSFDITELKLPVNKTDKMGAINHATYTKNQSNKVAKGDFDLGLNVETLKNEAGVLHSNTQPALIYTNKGTEKNVFFVNGRKIPAQVSNVYKKTPEGIFSIGGFINEKTKKYNHIFITTNPLPNGTHGLFSKNGKNWESWSPISSTGAEKILNGSLNVKDVDALPKKTYKTLFDAYNDLSLEKKTETGSVETCPVETGSVENNSDETCSAETPSIGKTM